jgi:hypothetical protein
LLAEQHRALACSARIPVREAGSPEGSPGQRTTNHCGTWPAHWVCVQVLCGMDRLLALGRRCGLHLLCHATATGEATAAVVASVAAAWLARWQAADPGLHYSVADEPSEEEAFLTRWALDGWVRWAVHWHAGDGTAGWAWVSFQCRRRPLPGLQVLFHQPPQRLAAAVAGPQPAPAAACASRPASGP